MIAFNPLIVNALPDLTPTHETYNSLQDAYSQINRDLFADQLPHCIIIMSKKLRRAAGYYGFQRYQGLDEDNRETVLDEIAINPHIMRRGADYVLSTLAHEMCHLWQYHFGKQSRGGYHNSQWADKMEEIGLTPSNTGAPGGKRTGQNMSDYITPGGRFERWVADWTAKNRFRWGSSDLLLINDGYLAPPDPTTSATSGEDGEETEQAPQPAASPKPKSKVKYSCSCSNVWGKPGLSLGCKSCGEDLQEVS